MAFTLTDSKLTRRAMHVTVQEVTLNDQDFSATFETLNALHGNNRGYTLFEIDSIYVEYAATATAVSRILAVEMQDSSQDPYMTFCCDLAIVASDVARVTFSPGVAQTATLRQIATPDVVLATAPMPKLTLLPLQTIRVYEIEGVDAADDMELYITGRFLRA